MKRTTKLLLVATVSLLAVGLATASVTAFGQASDAQTQDDPENVAVTLDGDATADFGTDCTCLDGGAGGGGDDGGDDGSDDGDDGDDIGTGGPGELEP